MTIINFFNWNEISINLEESYSILPISEQLGITSLIDPLKSFIAEMEKKAENADEYFLRTYSISTKSVLKKLQTSLKNLNGPLKKMTYKSSHLALLM